MKTKTLLIGMVVLLALVAVSARAADVTGKWVAQVEGRQGTQEYTFNFKVDGANLTGTITTARGESEISEGKVEGDEISFVVVRSFGGNEMKQLYKGKVAGDEITFTREFQGGFPGGGPGGGMGGPPGGGPPGGGMGGPPGGGGGQRPPIVAKRAK